MFNKFKDNNKSDSDYRKAHRPANEFSSRSEYLENELKIMKPRRWRLNLPGRDFRFEWEDLIPALAGTIGITVMYSAVMQAWAMGLSDKWEHINLGSSFAIEAVRVEMIIPAILFCVLSSGIFNPRANLSGNHGPMIPLIGAIALAGAHPLALAILICVFGLLLSFFKGGSALVNLTSKGVAGGLLIFLGFSGAENQIVPLFNWAASLQAKHALSHSLSHVAFIILAANVIIYAVLARLKKRWLAIPICSIASITVALSLGAGIDLTFGTKPGLPHLNPAYWWGSTQEGWMLGLPNISHFVASLPFAVLAIAMWSPDFLGHKIFQELEYPKGSGSVLMDVDDTMTTCSFRQIVGTAFGGGNVTSSWGTYLIPAAIAKRPIPAGAILLGLMCISVAIIGFPMDIAVWRPVMSIALLVGVFLPLLEAGMQMVKDAKDSQAACICIFTSFISNPVFAWALTMLLDNNGLAGNKDRSKTLSFLDRIIIPGSTFIICTIAMAAVGMLPGIPVFL
jgi:hypothetical protein